MSWGTVTVGGVPFREELKVSASGDQLALTGQEAVPPRTRTQVMNAHMNVQGLMSRTVPIVFSDKVELSGFYTISSAQSSLYSLDNGSIMTASWQMTANFLGFDVDLEFESRVPTVQRLTQLSGITPAYWHAPPVNTQTYYTGQNTANQAITRISSDGPITVYSGIPSNVAPRWSIALADYLRGASRILLDGLWAVGTSTFDYTAWEMHNGLVRITTSGPSIGIQFWSDSIAGWTTAKYWTPTVNGTALVTTPTVDILRNDPEEVTIRLVYPQSPGLFTVDLDLRRGARFVTGVIKRFSSATLGISRTAAEAANVVSGGLRATASDPENFRYTVGSTRTVTTTTSIASIAAASATRFDFFLGGEVVAAPQTGDAFADILAQYHGTTGERVRVVQR